MVGYTETINKRGSRRSKCKRNWLPLALPPTGLRARDASAAGTILGAASLGLPWMERMKNPSQRRRLGVFSPVAGMPYGEPGSPQEAKMRKQHLIRLVTCAALAVVPMMIPRIAAGQAP